MTTEQVREAKHQYEHWRDVGGVVFDVAELLENLARINGRGLCPYEVEKLAYVRKFATLVASHALRPVLRAVNEEQMKWHMEVREAGDQRV